MTADPNDVAALALLDEPVRRSLYDWIGATGRPVGRDEAATAVGISRALAAFHLDRLADAGLLVTEFKRLTGRVGPGAGRPSKLYRRASREIAVSLPERHYEVAAELLAQAVETIGAGGPPPALTDAARASGQDLGTAARKRAGRRPGTQRRRASLVEVLRERGYEPREVAGEIRLGNCPFDALAEDHRSVVCGMNLALAEGMLDGVGDTGLEARLDIQPGLCCVALGHRAGPTPEPASAPGDL